MEQRLFQKEFLLVVLIGTNDTKVICVHCGFLLGQQLNSSNDFNCSSSLPAPLLPWRYSSCYSLVSPVNLQAPLPALLLLLVLLLFPPPRHPAGFKYLPPVITRDIIVAAFRRGGAGSR